MLLGKKKIKSFEREWPGGNSGSKRPNTSRCFFILLCRNDKKASKSGGRNVDHSQKKEVKHRYFPGNEILSAMHKMLLHIKVSL